MPSLAPITDHAAPFLLVLFRLSGLMVFAPILASTIIPAKVRALMAVMFTLAIYPALPAAQLGIVPGSAYAALPGDVLSLAPLAFGEVLIGLAIGLLAAMPMHAVQLGGLIMGQQAGMNLGSVYNPLLETESDAVGQLLQYVAMVIFVAAGGLEALFLALATTFAHVPVGHGIGVLPPLQLLTGLTSSGFELALRVSAPVLCIILIETVVSSFVMKTMPQLNIMSIGFAVKIVAMLLALVAGLAAIAHAVGDDVSETMGAVMRWIDGLTIAAPGGGAAALPPGA